VKLRAITRAGCAIMTCASSGSKGTRHAAQEGRRDGDDALTFAVLFLRAMTRALAGAVPTASC
jgi:hypothetical protein